MRAWVLASALLAVGATAVGTRADDPPEIPVAIEKTRFDPDEMRVKAGIPFVLVITNKDGGPEEFESKELRIEKIIPAGKTVRLRMPPHGLAGRDDFLDPE